MILFNNKQRVIFFGDSITEAGTKRTGYISQLKALLKEQGLLSKYKLTGAGVSGNKITHLLNRVTSDLLSRRPQRVIIWIGVNDVWHQLQNRGTTATVFEEKYRQLVVLLKKEGIAVTLCTPAAIGEKKAGANAQDRELDHFAQIIRNLATEQDCLLVDLRREFLQYNEIHNTSNQEYGILTTDGVHLNETGNRLVATILLRTFE